VHLPGPFLHSHWLCHRFCVLRVHWGQTPWVWVHGRGPTLATTFATALLSHVPGAGGGLSKASMCHLCLGIFRHQQLPISVAVLQPPGEGESLCSSGILVGSNMYSFKKKYAAMFPPKCHSVTRHHMCDLSRLAPVDVL
jgi:hypothetical protein